MTPLYLALATAAASILFPGPKKETSGSSSSQRAVGSMSGGGRLFFFGVLTGIGLGACLTAELQRQRIFERIRSSFFAWLNEPDDDRTDNANDGNKIGAGQATRPSDLSVPTAALNVAEHSIGEAGSVLRTLVSPDTALTSTLNVSLITLPPRTRMIPREAKAVEMYYVIQGVGSFSKDGIDECVMSSGDVVAVNPWSARWIANKGRGDVVILRVTDGGNSYNEKGYDFVVRGDTSLQSTVGMFTTGIQKVGSVLGNKIRGQESDESKKETPP